MVDETKLLRPGNKRVYGPSGADQAGWAVQNVFKFEQFLNTQSLFLPAWQGRSCRHSKLSSLPAFFTRNGFAALCAASKQASPVISTCRSIPLKRSLYNNSGCRVGSYLRSPNGRGRGEESPVFAIHLKLLAPGFFTN